MSLGLLLAVGARKSDVAEEWTLNPLLGCCPSACGPLSAEIRRDFPSLNSLRNPTLFLGV
jgi:hypothetical protein